MTVLGTGGGSGGAATEAGDGASQSPDAVGDRPLAQVRVSEDEPRPPRGQPIGGDADEPDAGEPAPVAKGATSGTTESAARRATVRKLPEPGVLELEDLLSTYLNTRVKVDIQNRRGRLVVEFATLEDLERIYRAMVGDGGVA